MHHKHRHRHRHRHRRRHRRSHIRPHSGMWRIRATRITLTMLPTLAALTAARSAPAIAMAILRSQQMPRLCSRRRSRPEVGLPQLMSVLRDLPPRRLQRQDQHQQVSATGAAAIAVASCLSALTEAAPAAKGACQYPTSSAGANPETPIDTSTPRAPSAAS